MLAVATSPPLVAPEYTVHNSLTGPWHLAEVLPKRAFSARQGREVTRPNLWRRRELGPSPHIHESVLQRMRDVPEYRPFNLPEVYTVEPWERLKTVLRDEKPATPCD